MKKTSGDNMNIIENDQGEPIYDDYAGPGIFLSLAGIVLSIIVIVWGVMELLKWAIPSAGEGNG